MKIVADSSVMYSIAEGAERGIKILPLAVSIEGETWREYEDIDAAGFLSRVREGAVPTSSCPAPEAVVEAYNTEEEVLHLAMADGLSGAYQVAHAFAQQSAHPERVTVLNTRTLCVPHRAIALAAVELAKTVSTSAELAERLTPMVDSARSYLIPLDFDFLRRGGRLTPVAAKIAHILRAAPVMIQTEDGTRLEKFHLARSFKKGVASVVADLAKMGLGETHYVSVSHADNPKAAQIAIDKIRAALPEVQCGVFDLGPAFITQVGPGCVAIQLVDLAVCPDIKLG